LNKDLDSAWYREQDFKEMHRNYMLQMQFLIIQNVIAPPSPKDRDAPVSQAAEPSASTPYNSKPEIEKICKNCGTPFLTSNFLSVGVFASAKTAVTFAARYLCSFCPGNSGTFVLAFARAGKYSESDSIIGSVIKKLVASKGLYLSLKENA